MRIKRYVADNMQSAVAMVKADFGDDAVILHTKRFKRGGLFGLFGRPKVEIVAAIEPGARPAVRREGDLRRARQTTAAALEALQQEVRSLKEMIGSAGDDRSETIPGPVQAAWSRLREQEIDEAEVQRLLDDVIRSSDPDLLERSEGLWEHLTDRIGSSLMTTPPWQFEGEPVVVPVVGPTGVGKTTTVAKLAANFKMLAERRVGLVTADTYRVAAVEQLRTYADIIGIDLHVVYTPEELRAAVDRLADCDLILVDTAGRSQNNAMHMAELRSFLDVLPGAQVHLVVSAATRGTDLEDIAKRFAAVNFQRIIVTKVDETSVYGPLYELPRRTGAPLAYVTTGQSVPDDIEVADGARAARLIMGEAP